MTDVDAQPSAPSSEKSTPRIIKFVDSPASDVSELSHSPLPKSELNDHQVTVSQSLEIDTVTRDNPLQTAGIFSCIVKHYVIGFALALGIELLGLLLSYVFILQNPNDKLFPLDFKGVPINLKSDKTFLRLLAAKQINRDRNILIHEEDMIFHLPSTIVTSSLSVIYQADNVLTRERLQAMRDVEAWLIDHKMWNYVAVTDSTGNILKPFSLLRYFDGTHGSNFNDSDFSNIADTLYRAYTDLTLKEDVELLISKDAVITQTKATSRLTRSVFSIGVANYPELQEKTFWKYSMSNKLDDLSENGRAGMKVYYYNDHLVMDDLIHQVEEDILLAFGSFVFILLFILGQTQSFFITLSGMCSILLSFMWTNYIYRVLLQYKYFGIFHAASIFIILGIGADDLFVFYDLWRTTACMALASVEKRFIFTYRHACMSMLITSATTAAAFYSNAFTSLFGICSFAVFTGTLVSINYCSAILFFPMCVLFYQHHIAQFRWPWQYFYASIKDESIQNKPNFVVRFFKGPLYRFLTHNIMRWVLIVSCTGNGLFFAYLATKLQLSDKPVQYYVSGHNHQEASQLDDYGFKKIADVDHININIVFGVKEQDLSGCDMLDYNCLGRFSYDNRLDLNPIPAQKALLNACYMLKTLTRHDELHLIRDPKTKLVKARCFLENMNQFFLAHAKDRNFFNWPVDLSLPVSGIKYMQIAQVRPDLYNASIASGNFYQFFETAVSYWLTNAYRGNHTTGANYTSDVLLSVLLGMSFTGDDAAEIVTRPGEYYGTRLRYFIIDIPTSLINGQVDYQSGLKAHDAWENFTNTIMSQMPASAQGFQIATHGAWHLFKMYNELQLSAIRGIILGTALAFIVLTLATFNVILSFLATLDILLVIATFAGCLQLFGFKISVIESINLSLVAGLSVDYVVHFSQSYHHAPHDNRERKVRDMLEHMGVSVLSGAASTSGAALFMLNAKIFFFFQFGFFIILTTSLSLFYALFWFTPILAVIGPEEDLGSLTPLFRWIMKLVQPIKDELRAINEEQKKISYSRSVSD